MSVSPLSALSRVPARVSASLSLGRVAATVHVEWHSGHFTRHPPLALSPTALSGCYHHLRPPPTMKEGHGRSQSSVPLLPYTDSTPPSTPLSPSFRKARLPIQLLHRRRSLIFTLACLSVISLGVLASWSIRSSSSTSYAQDVPQTPVLAPSPTWVDMSMPSQHAELEMDEPIHEPESELEIELEYSPYVVGAPTQSFRDNLRNDTKYITSWLSAGWSTLFFLFSKIPRKLTPRQLMML